MGIAQTPELLAAWVSLHDVARMLGCSYWSAYAFAASGALGQPTTIGRQHFFNRDLAEAAVAKRLEQRRTQGRHAPITTDA